jgi:hypothetical protein
MMPANGKDFCSFLSSSFFHSQEGKITDKAVLEKTRGKTK